MRRSCERAGCWILGFDVLAAHHRMNTWVLAERLPPALRYEVNGQRRNRHYAAEFIPVEGLEGEITGLRHLSVDRKSGRLVPYCRCIHWLVPLSVGSSEVLGTDVRYLTYSV
jgi:hypothetical protein